MAVITDEEEGTAVWQVQLHSNHPYSQVLVISLGLCFIMFCLTYHPCVREDDVA